MRRPQIDAHVREAAKELQDALELLEAIPDDVAKERGVYLARTMIKDALFELECSLGAEHGA